MEKIEILSEEFFESHRNEMEIVEQFQSRFSPVLGWHYLLDLAWILREIRSCLQPGALILDAGAGSGILQLILAELGYNVISADFVGREFSQEYLKRYKGIIHHLNSQRSSMGNRYTRHIASVYNREKRGILAQLSRLGTRIGLGSGSLDAVHTHRFTPQMLERAPLFQGDASNNCGRIFLYRCDLKQMPLIPDGYVDAVVSLSALEHNQHDSVESCVAELVRVVKISGRLVITVSASQSEDWFHEPSKGWCYSETSLKRLFQLPEKVTSNFYRKNELYEKLKSENSELRTRLAPAYFESGDNGMPWGRWNPVYQPVGIVKIKSR